MQEFHARLDTGSLTLEAWVSAVRHLAGQIVTVRLHPTVLQVFFAGQLIRTVPQPAPDRAPAATPR